MKILYKVLNAQNCNIGDIVDIIPKYALQQNDIENSTIEGGQ
jgi:hypothetical protein